MKQIEKLAIEHVEAQLRSSASDLIKIYSQADYTAGFRKAREMAAAESVRYFSHGKEVGPMSWRIRNLGESEAEDNPPVYDPVESANNALLDLKKKPPGSFALVCVKHPIMRDELCSTCWEAKHRNDLVLKSQPGMNAVGVEI